MLAIAYARAGDSYWVRPESESSTMFPGRFVVVDTAGGLVTELRVEGKVLAPELAWSSDSGMVALKTVTVEPYTDDALPWVTHEAVDSGVYTGPLAGPFAQAWAGDPASQPGDGSGCGWFGFLADGRLALGLNLVGKRQAVRIKGAAGGDEGIDTRGSEGAAVDLEGYNPAELWGL